VTGQLPFVEKMRFVTSGTEAVMSALRVARGATGRDKVLKFEGCYHGHVDSLLVKAGSGLAGAAAADSAGVSSAVAATTLVTPLDDEAKLEEIFAKEGPNIAAVILEPLPANYGLLVQREEFWRRTLDLARRHGALVIFDEVISGFRVAMGGMAERLRMSPDLVTYGKILGGGLPVGAYGGRRDLLDLVAPSGPVYQAGTLSAGSLGMAAGLATLEKARRLNVHSILEHRTERFARELNSRFARADLPFLVDHVGSIFWIRPHSLGPIRTIAQIPSNHGAQFKRLFQACLKRGVYLAPSGYEVGFVTLAHTDAVLEKAIEAISAAAQEAHGPT
jgi:glutamate-1-semialdehyde 2,1-aminomutase